MTIKTLLEIVDFQLCLPYDESEPYYVKAKAFLNQIQEKHYEDLTEKQQAWLKKIIRDRVTNYREEDESLDLVWDNGHFYTWEG